MRSFMWGKVIERFEYDFDGEVLEVVKYHPWNKSGSTLLRNDPNLNVVEYHCEAIRQSFNTLDGLLIAWIANRRIGGNQHYLVQGVCRALLIPEGV